MIMPTAEIQLLGVLFQLKPFDFETLPWWIPGAIVVVGIAFYGIPQCDRVLSGQLPEWRVLPRWVRIPFTGLFFGGAGVIVFATLQQYNWMYVLFLFGYARAVEGATILHLFGRITSGVEALKRAISRSESTSTSTSPSPSRWSVAWVVSLIPFVSVGSRIGRGLRWILRRIVKRLPIVITTLILSVLAVGLIAAMLIGFPADPVTVKLAWALTVTTLTLSMVNGAWVLTKVTDELSVWEFLGVLCCLVGGELYNVPSALGLFSGVPAVEGPLGAWTATLVGTIGWSVGLVLATAFFVHAIRRRETPTARGQTGQ